MENILLSIFFILLISIPFLYRFIRVGKFGWFFNNTFNLVNDQKYIKAEKFRIFQVMLGAFFFFIHGSMHWGFFNIALFMFITFFLSLFLEIIGSKTGYIFGGKYHYNKGNTPGYIIFDIPILIPIAWFGIIYMAINFCCYLTNTQFPFENTPNYYFITLTSISIMLLDIVLDPLAVDEKRWEWESLGIYYGVPILNFIGWLIVPTLTIIIFNFFSYSQILRENSYSVLFKYFPAILFVFLPMIASRPCFERGLRIPGYLGITISFAYVLIVISQL